MQLVVILVTLYLTVTTIDFTVSLTTGTTTTSILSNTAGASYQWLDCDNGNAAISGETGQAFTATGVGSYAVVVSLNNCTDTSDCVDVINVGISDNFIEEQVSIFPNPNAGMVFMDFGSLTGLSFKVFNTLGQMVLEENNLDSSQYKLELKGEAGLYFVEVNAEGKLAYFKLVKK